MAGDWEQRLLKIMGAPDTADNETALSYWAQSEGTPSSWNNWLATTENCCGGVDVNSAGVKAYPNIGSGINATWATLQGGAYTHIVSAFRNSASLGTIWSAINQSPWCGGCQNGLYPVALYDILKTGGHVPTPSNPPPAAAPKTPGLDATRTAWETFGDFGTRNLPSWWNNVHGAGATVDAIGK